MTIELISRLVETLEQEQIRYCHWKSNAALDVALAGDTDLDLLVSKEDEQKFGSVLSQLNFTRAISPQEGRFGRIYHYYGYDAGSDKMVHIHLHYELNLGHDLIKNYHLPVEEVLLDSVTDCNGIKIPAYELEFIVLVIRMVLKHRLLSVLLGHPKRWIKALAGKGRELSESAQRELDFLIEKTNAEKVDEYLGLAFGFFDAELFKSCLSSLSCKPKPFASFIMGRRLCKALRQFERRPSLWASTLALTRMLSGCAKSVLACLGFKIQRKKRLDCGGKIIAIVGSDGSGKSTNIDGLGNWLSEYFDVRTIHMGKPRKGLLGFCAYVFVKIWQKITRRKVNKFADSVMYWLVGRNRYRAFCRAKRLRMKGIIVLLDRFPLPQLSFMDTPRIRKLTGGKGIYSALAHMEENYHRRIRGVDELIVLKIDPETAAQRRPKDDQDFLRERAGEIWNMVWPRGYADIVDAGEPLEDVKKKVREIVCSSINKRPKVIEMIGPAGAGKTTLAKELLKRTTNVRTIVSVKGHRVQLFKTLVGSLPRLIYLLLQRVPYRLLSIMLNIQVVLDVLQCHKRRHLLDCRCAVLDQGPILRLTCLQCQDTPGVEKQGVKDWLKQLMKQAHEALDAIVYLDAPDEILQSRINGREKEHRIKKENSEAASVFLDNYRQTFEMAIGDGSKILIPIVRIDTEENPIDSVVDTIIELAS